MAFVGLDVATTTGATVHANGKYFASSFTAKSPVKHKTKQERVAESLGVKVSSLDAPRTGSLVLDFERRLYLYLLQVSETHGPIQAVAVEKPLVPNHERTKTVIDTSSEWAGKAVRKEKVAGTNESTIHLLNVLAGTAAKVCAQLNIPCEFIDQTTWRKAFLGSGRPGSSDQCKKLAKKVCEQMGIVAVNADAAESVGVCFALVQKMMPYGGRANDLFAKPQSPSKTTARENAERLFARTEAAS